MAQGSVFLIGGGWNEAGFSHTYGPFAVAAGDGGRIAVVLLDDEDRDAYFGRSAAAFAAIGVTNVAPVFVSAERPLQEADVEGAAGILVGGGLTPAYHDAIVPSAGPWLRQRVEGGMPYAGFSAGAMIAPAEGIIGGWKLGRGDDALVICSEDVSEDEEELDVRAGIGLAPFAVDVHASQYGTPTRLMHAVRAGRVSEGWAVDEDTMIEMSNGRVSVHGLGSAYHVRPDGDALAVTILGHGVSRDIG
jgi:cyanophycinase